MSAYQTDSRIDDYIQTLAFLVAGDVPPGARAGARRRPGGDRDHQAHQVALFYAAWQYLREASSHGSSHHFHLRPHRARSRGHY